MADEILDEIIDESGVIRRLGSLVMPEGMVSAFPVLENTVVPWDDADIKRALLSPDRVPSRTIFGDRWISDQHSTSECNGHAAANAFGRARWLSGLRDGLQFSGAWIYSLINGHRDNGSILEKGMLAGREHGYATADLVKWNMIFPEDQPPGANAEAAKRKAIEAYRCQTFQGFRTAMAAGYLCIVAVHAGRNWGKLDKNGISGVDNGKGNHALCADDATIIGGDEVYDIPGSWNLTFGERGRSYARKEHFQQTFPHHVFYAIPLGGVNEE